MDPQSFRYYDRQTTDRHARSENDDAADGLKKTGSGNIF